MLNIVFIIFIIIAITGLVISWIIEDNEKIAQRGAKLEKKATIEYLNSVNAINKKVKFINYNNELKEKNKILNYKWQNEKIKEGTW